MPLVIPPEVLCCPMAKSVFRKPVFISDCFSYEESWISEWFKARIEAKQPVLSPLKGSPLPSLEGKRGLQDLSMKPNLQLRGQISTYRDSLLSEKKLYAAITSGDLKSLRSMPFVDPSQHPESSANAVFSPMHLAVAHGQLDILKYLIKDCKMDARVKEANGNSLLHAISPLSTVAIVRYLITECKLGLEVENDAHRTPLLEALVFCCDCSPQFVDAMEEMLIRGANPKHTTADFTVLSAGTTCLRLVQLLLKYGADDPRVLNHKTADGGTFLQKAYEEEDCELFKYYISLLAGPEKRIAMVRQLTKTGYSLLHFAVACPMLLKLLLDPPYSLDPSAVTTDGDTVLHCMTDVQVDTVDPIRQVMTIGQSLQILLGTGKVKIDERNHKKRTALHKAARHGAWALFQALSRAGMHVPLFCLALLVLLIA
jgi:ankyrin repeat protein